MLGSVEESLDLGCHTNMDACTQDFVQEVTACSSKAQGMSDLAQVPSLWLVVYLAHSRSTL